MLSGADHLNGISVFCLAVPTQWRERPKSDTFTMKVLLRGR